MTKTKYPYQPELIRADLNDCPNCGEPINFMEFIPAHKHMIADMPDFSGCYYIVCNDDDCGYGMSGTNKEQLIERWNNSEA